MAEKKERMMRLHLLMTPEQRRRLERLALVQRQSLSETARRALELGLDALEGRTDEEITRARDALRELDALREETRARHGVVTRDFVDEAREEREEDRGRFGEVSDPFIDRAAM